MAEAHHEEAMGDKPPLDREIGLIATRPPFLRWPFSSLDTRIPCGKSAADRAECSDWSSGSCADLFTKYEPDSDVSYFGRLQNKPEVGE